MSSTPFLNQLFPLDDRELVPSLVPFEHADEAAGISVVHEKCGVRGSQQVVVLGNWRLRVRLAGEEVEGDKDEECSGELEPGRLKDDPLVYVLHGGHELEEDVAKSKLPKTKTSKLG